MKDINVRVEDARKSLTGNESLLDMLDSNAAQDLLKWGIELADQIAKSTDGMDDVYADQNMELGLKALRQFIRAVGNWAVGKYDLASRAGLKEKLIGNWGSIAGSNFVGSEELGKVLNFVDDKNSQPRHLISILRSSFAPTGD